ncbi:hypothetical protein [Vibrio phage vB_ValP_IME234]|nr:hypothetical protein [Vibrio phage vB_ValP_IME234]
MAIYKIQREKIGNITHLVRVQVLPFDVYCKVCEEYHDAVMGDEDDFTIQTECNCDIDDFFTDEEYDDVVEERDRWEIKAEELEEERDEAVADKDKLEQEYIQEIETLRANNELTLNTLDIEREEHQEAIELRDNIIDELEAKLRELEG